MSKETLIQKVIATLSKAVGGSDLIKEIKDFKLKLAEQTPEEKAAAEKAEADKKAAVKMTDVKTKDGLKVITFEGEKLDVNVPVTIKNSDGTPAETDGEFVLENGDTITVAAGIVSAIKKAEAEAEKPAENLMPIDMPMLMTKLSTEVEVKFSSVTNELNKKIETLTAQNAELTKITKTLLAFNQALIEIPVEEKGIVLDKEEFEKLTSLQKRRYQKENAKV